jgi:hypothetical protein
LTKIIIPRIRIVILSAAKDLLREWLELRRILVDYARRCRALRRGGGLRRVELESDQAAVAERSERLIALDEALERRRGPLSHPAGWPGVGGGDLRPATTGSWGARDFVALRRISAPRGDYAWLLVRRGDLDQHAAARLVGRRPPSAGTR